MYNFSLKNRPSETNSIHSVYEPLRLRRFTIVILFCIYTSKYKVLVPDVSGSLRQRKYGYLRLLIKVDRIRHARINKDIP